MWIAFDSDTCVSDTCVSFALFLTVLYFNYMYYMYFVIFQGEDSRYAVMHLVQTFCDVSYVCRNKIFKIEIDSFTWQQWKVSLFIGFEL